ncbi:MAG: FlgD immunoglobulin-like domain containing protein [Candidatus Krumholzibacteriota bacterium]
MKFILGLMMVAALAGNVLGANGVSSPGILDGRAPAIQVVYPTGMEIMRSSTPETLRFTIDEQSWGSPPGEITLHFLVEGSPPDQTTIPPESNGSYMYVWDVPTLPGYNDIEARIRVDATDGFGWSSSQYSNWFMVMDDVSAVPAPRMVDRLGPVHPNPFNPQTTISFSLATPGDIHLAVFDVRGRQIATVAREHLEAGDHRNIWDGRTDDGSFAASGSYFALLSINGPSQKRTLVTRLTLVK